LRHVSPSGSGNSAGRRTDLCDDQFSQPRGETLLTTPVAIEIDDSLDPFARANLDDPYPYYTRLRGIGPVLFVPSRNVYLATTYDAVDAALRDFRTFSSAHGAFYPEASTGRPFGRRRFELIRRAYERAPDTTGKVLSAVMGRFGSGLLKRDPYPMTTPFIDADPPRHTNNRRAVQPFFTKQAVEQAAPMVRGHVCDLVERALGQRNIDAVQALSIELPSRVIADFTGMRAPEQHVFNWAQAIFDMGGAEPARATRQHAAQAYAWLLNSGTRDLPEGCLSRQVIESGCALDAGGVLAATADRILGLGAIWSAALDTTTSLISNMLNAFAEYGDQWERLHANPQLAESAVEEALRFDSPIRMFFRTTTAQTVLGGVVIPAQTRVGVIFAAANRDPAKFAEPDRFDIGRKPNAHLAFGASIHLCLGAPLARLEARLLLQELARRVRFIERPAAGQRTANSLTHGFAKLPLRLVEA
jgi:cytochrome P450